MTSRPSLTRIHNPPIDCSRWTETGFKHFLAGYGLPPHSIETGSWGNRSCVKAAFSHRAERRRFGSQCNEPDSLGAVLVLDRKAPA